MHSFFEDAMKRNLQLYAPLMDKIIMNIKQTTYIFDILNHQSFHFIQNKQK